MKKFTALLILALSVSSPLHAEDYDPQHTMLALNMAIVSVHRILTTQSRAVLEQEYTNIINNLSLGNIASDKDMTALYRDLLAIISSKRAREEDSKRLKSYYDTAEQRLITHAMSAIRTQQAQALALQSEADTNSAELSGIGSEQSSVITSWLGNMAVSCVSSFFGIFSGGSMLIDTISAYESYQELEAKRETAQRDLRRAQSAADVAQTALSGLREELKKDEAMLREELKASLWQLERQDLAECSALQERLLQSSWNLLRKYKLPDEYRLTQGSLKNFYRAVQEQDPSRRARMLRNLEDEFRAYPPYWYYRAKTAQESGNLSEARKFFAEFNEVWRPVLRRDPYKLEAEKFMVQELASSGKPITQTRPELLAHLETAYDNTPKDDWANNLFLGVAYFLLGDKSKGMDTIAINLDFGYEQKISGMLFAQMEKGALDSAEAQEAVERMKLSELITSMNIADTDSALALSLYFEGNAESVVKLAKTSDNPVILHAMRLIEQSKAGAGNYAQVMEYTKRHEALKAKIHASYTEILPLVKKYADDGRENAELFFADMMMYGWGVSQDREKAAEIFARLAERGNVYAQFVMVQSHLVAGLSREEIEELYQTGEKYFYGRGVPRDRKKACEYYLRAAELGHAEAQYSLGFCYEYGVGVARDTQKAREWLGKAAAQGHEKARDQLEDMNARGE